MQARSGAPRRKPNGREKFGSAPYDAGFFCGIITINGYYTGFADFIAPPGFPLYGNGRCADYATNALRLWHNNTVTERGGGMDVRPGDILQMKKPHPCGNSMFLVLRSGMDFKIRCTKCGREVMVPRLKCEKNIRKIIREAETKKDDL